MTSAKKKEFILKIVSAGLALAAAVLFVAHYAGPRLLRLYVEFGIGNCHKIPILCTVPSRTITDPQTDKEYLSGLLPYTFPKMAIKLPKGFTVVQETVRKVYYKRHKRMDKGSVVYLLYQPPGFLINLFPQVKKLGITDNHAFLKRTMYAQPKDIRTLTDVFFVVMKSIFIPDLGQQSQATMAEVSIGENKGFLNYNLTREISYFECSLVNAEGEYFKVYIKDKSSALDLNKFLNIISTMRRAQGVPVEASALPQPAPASVQPEELTQPEESLAPAEQTQ